MASIDSPSNPDVPLKCYAVPYGVLHFTVSFFMLCYDVSSRLGYNIWTPWKPSSTEIKGPLSLLSLHFTNSPTSPSTNLSTSPSTSPSTTWNTYRVILGVRDAVQLVGCCVAFAVSTYTVCKCDGYYQLTGIWRMTDAFTTMLRVSIRLYRRHLRSTPNFLASAITIFLALL